MISAVVDVLLFCIIAYGLFQWCLVFYHMVALTKHYKDDIDPWSWRTGFNPFNGLVSFGWLKPEGRIHAKKCWFAIGKFVLIVSVPWLLAILLRALTGVDLLEMA
ncbi:hypothetical protein BST95_02925 [Halioglobus japonicus]|uniref:Uncharacterized protein n=1 Tax=Halioglobus japonicus TaxID=930805 RepID=A0AAP8MCG8_9GAMM|nr:hypothetical protein [Halioglobus japonicus]AQA17335.1 hypothetical protein BST95_02925 [Halioglobus japonicus]PLW85256.1 hypothetical protein C0029_11495 [Halioglobus japonicus]